MTLHGYWRSTTTFRVRAALNLKGLAYAWEPVDLLAGAQHAAGFVAMNPAQGVPALVLEDGTVLTQSLAIIAWLDALHPEPRLLPEDPLARARVEALSHVVAMDIHPVNNLRVVDRLHDVFGATQAQARDWMIHWMERGFAAAEAMVAPEATFTLGEAPGMADLCLVAQLYNARRWEMDLAPYPNLRRVEAACHAVPEIAAAHPDTHQTPEAIA
ncbi:Maleylpyruvate isomerase [Pseudoruegeria aquimaris]|uniref:Maleylpyruvate isomerase n=1 Tax=Pseudoruegeria aquimaris TaxID=393663 RepID=A0A1Y5RFB3_9RHOB|nr:maleylacetoacetate isomerase [Pseudoruegeria aquimaris]SLN16222.1 Maleylpyruvate isomerase [Pseudoruegeria aquimaris]